MNILSVLSAVARPARGHQVSGPIRTASADGNDVIFVERCHRQFLATIGASPSVVRDTRKPLIHRVEADEVGTFACMGEIEGACMVDVSLIPLSLRIWVIELILPLISSATFRALSTQLKAGPPGFRARYTAAISNERLTSLHSLKRVFLRAGYTKAFARHRWKGALCAESFYSFVLTALRSIAALTVTPVEIVPVVLGSGALARHVTSLTGAAA